MQKRKITERVMHFAGILACALLVFGAEGCDAQKTSSWAMDNAHIGPDSPIEIPIGGSYQASVASPTPDGPLIPLKATVVWSITPEVKGIAIDPATGKITVAKDVPAGTTATVHANVANGTKKLTAKVVVFNPADIPLMGAWKVQSVVACDEGQKVVLPHSSAHLGDHWGFRVDKTVWVGVPYGIAATTRWTGTYEHDVASGRIKFARKWIGGSTTEDWKVEMVSDREVRLTILQPPTPADNVCAYVLTRSGKAN